MTKKQKSNKDFYAKNREAILEKAKKRYELKKTENSASKISEKNLAPEIFSDNSSDFGAKILQFPKKFFSDKEQQTKTQEDFKMDFKPRADMIGPQLVAQGVSVGVKILIVLLITIFLTWCNYNFGLMDESVKALPKWLGISVFGLLEVSLMVLAGLQFSRTLKYPLILAIMAYSVFGASQSFKNSIMLNNGKFEGLASNIEILKKEILEKEKYIVKNEENRGVRWVVVKTKKELSDLNNRLEKYNNEKIQLLDSKTAHENVNGQIVFRFLLVIISVVFSKKIAEELRQLGKQMGYES